MKHEVGELVAALEREGYVQLAYKHAVSTIQPVTPVDLQGEDDEG